MITPSISILLQSALNFLLYQVFPFLFILAFCIIIHEIGHFLFAKLFGIPVEKFSIGFGPPLLRTKIGDTDFRIAYFPFGGYVKMAGEEEGEGGYYDAPLQKRAVVVISGPLLNILSAVFVFILAFAIYGISINPYTKVMVDEDSFAAKAGFTTGDSIFCVNNKKIKNWDEFEEVLILNKDKEIAITMIRNGQEITKNLIVNIDSLGLTPFVPPILGSIKKDGPAYKAGLKPNDCILRIDGVEIRTWYDLVERVRKSNGVILNFEWQHEGGVKTARITPAPFYDPMKKETIGQIGIFMPLKKEYEPLPEIIKLSVNRTFAATYLTLKIFYQLIKREVSTKALGGPIAILKLSVESARWGMEYLLGLLALISINLGIINLFPIPALDGGHVLILLIEAIRRKRFSKHTRIIIQQVGYTIILLLIIFATFNDITRR